jgi:amino acid adenylation domain-containing protein
MKREEELARRRAGLSEAKRALLAERLQHSLQQNIPSVSIKRRESDQKMGLSFAQQRLWFLDQLAPSNPFYNMPLTIHLDGLLQVSILFRCLQELIERHESLRTNFVLHGDEPVQVITEGDRLSLPLIDLQELPEEQKGLTVQQLSEVEAQRPFDLSHDPLMRTTLLRLKPQKHILLMTMHHIITDGWSMGILYHELTVLYQAFREGIASPLPPLPLQYADYAIFQREWLQGELPQKQLAYWREQLANLTPLDLPLDYLRPPLQTFRGSVLSFTLEASLVQKIQALCQQEGITLFIVLLSAFQMLLARYTGSDDIAVGTPIAGRTEVELEGLVGFFVNTLVIRTDLSSNLLLRDILRSVHHVVEAAFNHQDVPFEKLVEELQPERSLSQNPLIQTLFTLSVPVDKTRDIAGLRLHAEEQESQTTQFDLMLTMSEVQDGIIGQFQYDTNLFDLSTIQRLAKHFSALLQAIVDTPQQTLWDTPILSYEEQRQILHEWNASKSEAAGAQADCPQEMTIHQLFEQQVEQTPDSVALVFEDETLTYMDLNRRANQLAHHLQRLGMGPEVFVGVCLSRSVEMVVGLLAVLKVGGAYVPLDPSYPQERLAWMLSDSQATIILTHHLLDRSLGLVSKGIQSINLDTDWQVIDQSRQENPQISVESTHLAYLMYTSGSTGVPKGVQIPHRALINFLTSMKRQFQLTAKDTMLSVTPFSFDIAGLELFLPLVTGSRVVVVSREVTRDGERLATALLEHGSTIMQATPSTWRLLLSTSGLDTRPLHILCGGETLPPDLARRLLDLGRTVWNLYGPTETTIWSTVYPVASVDGPLPIGRPIANTEVYLLDRDLQPVPIGVTGELYIGGEGLARGYINRPDLTAERFVPHPWGSLSGERLYRTGDLARYQANGTIEYLGRSDSQVKLRGYRIELGEIEATLQTHPAVQEAVVILREVDETSTYLAPTTPSLVAYVVRAAESEQEMAFALLEHLRKHLPDYMIPTHVVELPSLPLSPNGKVNRKALPEPSRTAQRLEGYVAPQSELEQRLSEIWQQVLGVRTQVGVNENFFDLGGHSLLLIGVRSKLEAYLGYEVPVVDLFQYPTIHALSTYLSGQQEQQALFQPIAERVRKRKGTLSPEELQTSHDGVAIVGLSGRFPGARNIDEFWQNLCNGVESISFFSEEELLASGIAPELIHDPRYVKAHAILDDVESFDAAFFGYSPKEAAMMDPQQRLFLECAWEVLEQAGVGDRSSASDTYQGPIGVYAGQSASSYLLSNVLANPTFLAENGTFSTLITNDKDFLATRTSYKLNLEGPSMTIQTACSTSLVAVHMACQGLLRYECYMALAGGVSIVVPQKMGYLYEEESIVSPDGHCRAFDAEARGTIAGSGVGIVALKRLADALADGDTIYAVIRGSAINNDGAAKVGYTAPSIKGQVNVIAEAMTIAGVEPESISYVETHGTGTALGDPIEIAALTQAFRAVGTGECPVPTCAIGSVKTNLGHLDVAAGIAGLIKTVLALKHGMLPPSLHFHHPNPNIDFAHSPFYVNTHLQSWKRGSTPRRAGVSSFGIGGTNAHVILEEAPLPRPSTSGRSYQLLVLSARTASALQQHRQNLAQHLSQAPEVNLADVAYTLQVGRHRFEHRLMLVCRNQAQAVAELEREDSAHVQQRFDQRSDRPLVFLFPGVGEQYPGMTRELYQQEPSFRQVVDECCAYLKLHHDLDLLPMLALDSNPALLHGSVHNQNSLDLRALLGRQAAREGPVHPLSSTLLAQPTVFVLEYALARLLLHWGLVPAALMGYSLGEYVAACVSGVLSLHDALSLVVQRARLIAQLRAGCMIALMLSEHEVQGYLGEQVFLAAVNTSQTCVLAGDPTAIEQLEQRLLRDEVITRRITASHAFHTPLLKSVGTSLHAHLSTLQLKEPQIPYVSNVTGTWITAEEATDPQYWVRHMCEAIQWQKGVGTLLQGGEQIMLEVGTGQTLGSFVRQHEHCGREQMGLVFPLLPGQQEKGSEQERLMTTLGLLWLNGAEISWERLVENAQRRRVVLPTYPFERQRYWTLGSKPFSRTPDRAPATALSRLENLQREDLSQWFYLPAWKQSLPSLAPDLPRSQMPRQCWLIFADHCGMSHALKRQLEQHNQDVVVVIPGQTFEKLGPTSYAIDPKGASDYESLLKDMLVQKKAPARIIHAWSVTTHTRADLATCLALGLFSLMYLAQALGNTDANPCRTTVITSDLHDIIGSEPIQPEKATILGGCRVIPREYPQITCQNIDISFEDLDTRQETLLTHLMAELLRETSEPVVALRNRHRWVETFERVSLPATQDASPALLREGGVYLITGGLGGIGMAMAEHLAKFVQARLVLIARTELPPRERWSDLLLQEADDDITRKIRQVKRLEELGSQVLVLSADVADEEQMRTALEQVLARFDALHGVIHAAGVPGIGLIQIKTTEQVYQVLAPKVIGTLVLDRLLNTHELDFLVLYSSITAITGGLGQIDYCAANAFLDAFAHRNATRHGRTIAVNWSEWQWNAWETGLSGYGRELENFFKHSRRRFGIHFDEGWQALTHILAHPLPQVIVSPQHFPSLVEMSPAFTTATLAQQTGASGTKRATHGRPSLANAYVSPDNGVQQTIVHLWEELLGIEGIGIHDNFFALGGHSLLATQLITRLRDTFQVDLTLRTLFEEPTIARLTTLLFQKKAELVDDALLLQDIEDVEHLTDDEVQALLAADRNQTERMQNR